MSDRPLKPEEKKAWEQVRRSVRPLHGGKTMPRARGPAATKPLLEQPAAKSTSETPSVHRPDTVHAPRDRSADREVRRGKVSISARFDLHGHTQASAWSALPAFLAREQARGSRCVIVITGKGKAGGGILRHNFLRWIEMPEARTLVSGFATAHPKHGGAGAFYVFLRKR
ncbi:MAG: DNA mismatch repair protein MutS [Henriciella sp.]|jgi:DNA-nicking Smr family endonuclease|uniref:Smr/MutS family protein n=1 Tax=Henriciella sp. TaxID=1968823 RepID=UPI000C0CD3C9|nr:Smr/MutS family protein [Henriciella sp.]MAN75136.1 DNA mismatch repair protein MutS [Henriciella sp.]MBF33667.1 DNA mismatch repair protein MutS [Hyphomonadaceae bacterium]PHR73555.1 MAG: DNA mismatch repair protein MutS [Henriciella sp.]|tara:strand:- start:153 stop:662 length:510 start_codon:yes stop_codon:yes gene_type:complete